MAFNLDDYFRTAFEGKLLVKMPEREDEYLTPATRLLEKRREMAEIEHALLAQKEDFQMKMESLQQRRDELERKEEELKDSVFKFDKFLKENDSKRSRAEKKANAERLVITLKEKETARLQEEIKLLTQRREQLGKHVEKYAIFQSYLQNVLEKSEEFQDISEMVNRFNTLVATQAKLMERESDSQETMELERARLHQYTEEMQNGILQLNNELAGLKIKLEKAQSTTLQLESKWAHIQNTAVKKTLLIGKIKMATFNIFQILTKQMRLQPDVPVNDPLGQLDKIQDCMTDLFDILTKVKKYYPTVYTHALAAAN
ncbi:cilia- and flagella-associated protein 73 [Microcaecilia unicolor]|uniref:Cilia- and flagella-associated protein 73 n=1 Tax=Microcaecilia unicolor TaxID=1415580 RepID=A0A6P7ZJS7_9AMPH|nr:cilia- and flagella-associated protein 73 [Microcaecilia unicolor]